VRPTGTPRLRLLSSLCQTASTATIQRVYKGLSGQRLGALPDAQLFGFCANQTAATARRKWPDLSGVVPLGATKTKFEIKRYHTGCPAGSRCKHATRIKKSECGFQVPSRIRSLPASQRSSLESRGRTRCKERCKTM